MILVWREETVKKVLKSWSAWPYATYGSILVVYMPQVLLYKGVCLTLILVWKEESVKKVLKSSMCLFSGQYSVKKP